MTDVEVIIREQDVRKLASFCQALGEALGRSGLAPDRAFAVWHAAVMGQCSKCGFPISGEDLFALSQPPGEDPPAKLRRLRLGDCAQPGCESYFYRLVFRAHPPLDWPALLAGAEAMRAETGRPASAKARTAALARGFLQWGGTRRAAIGVGVLLLLLLIRRWYAGQRIPLLREPEHFNVAPAPEEPQPTGTPGPAR